MRANEVSFDFLVHTYVLLLDTGFLEEAQAIKRLIRATPIKQ